MKTDEGEDFLAFARMRIKGDAFDQVDKFHSKETVRQVETWVQVGLLHGCHFRVSARCKCPIVRACSSTSTVQQAGV